MGNAKIPKNHAEAFSGILIAPLKRPRVLICRIVKSIARHGWHTSISTYSALNPVRNGLEAQCSYETIFDVARGLTLDLVPYTDSVS